MAALMGPCSKLHHSWAHETASLSSWGSQGRAYCVTHVRSSERHLVLPEGIAREKKETRYYRKRLDTVNIVKWLLWTRCTSSNFQWILAATLWEMFFITSLNIYIYTPNIKEVSYWLGKTAGKWMNQAFELQNQGFSHHLTPSYVLCHGDS